MQDGQSRLMAHQHLGLAEIQGLAGLGELFDTLVVFENYPVERGGLLADAEGLRLSDVSGRDGTHYPLSLAARAGERLQLRLSYRPDLFERSSVETIAARLVRLLEAAVADPGRAIGSLEILSATERDTILREWNDTARAIPAATLPELFAAQVAKSPAATAVVFEDQSLSYGELDARSSQLAHHLRALGVGPEVVVGLCLERSLEMLVGLLGILKAGGAYLPLDPSLPAQSASPSCSTMRTRQCSSPIRRCSTGCPQMALALSLSTPTGRRLPDTPSPPLPSASIPATPPTSSTPRVRQEPQRASASPTLASPILQRFTSIGSPSRPRPVSYNSHPSALMRRCRRSRPL